jgi:hypothetical protein
MGWGEATKPDPRRFVTHAELDGEIEALRADILAEVEQKARAWAGDAATGWLKRHPQELWREMRPPTPIPLAAQTCPDIMGRDV